MPDKRIKFLDNGEIEFKEVVYPGETAYNDNVTFDKGKWFKDWENLIEEIKKMSLEVWQINDIFDEFKTDLMLYGFTKQLIQEHYKIKQLETKLKLAFHQSYSNYRNSRRIFLGFIAGLFANKAIEKLNVDELISKYKNA